MIAVILFFSRYYEVEILTPGTVKVGWQQVGAAPDHEVGGDDLSWAYDGSLEEKIHGDQVGAFLNTLYVVESANLVTLPTNNPQKNRCNI